MKTSNIIFYLGSLLGITMLSGCHKEAPMHGAADGTIVFYGHESTKGSSVTGMNMEEMFGEKGLDIKAIHHSKDYFRTDEKLFCLSPGIWATCESYHWPSDADDALSFWAWALDRSYGGETSNVVATDEALQLHFKMAPSTPEGMDAVHQNELMVGSHLGATRRKDGNGVALEFGHALSAVKINVGRANAGCLRSITLCNVFSEADCRVSASEDSSAQTSSMKIAWSGHEGRSDFRQDFGTMIEGNLGEGNYQDVSTSAMADKDGTIFMMIPQELEGAAIKVDYLLAGKDTSEVYTNALKGMWESGRTYIYTLNILGGLGVEVKGMLTEKSASAVGFTNNGECPCYLRATIVGTWDNDNGDILQPASGEDIEVVRDPSWDDFWFFDPDSHIYYYRYPLRGSESVAVNLFEHFNTDTGPDGTHMNMTVMVQAIKHDPDLSSVKAAIGEANGYADLLYTDFYEKE